MSEIDADAEWVSEEKNKGEGRNSTTVIMERRVEHVGVNRGNYAPVVNTLDALPEECTHCGKGTILRRAESVQNSIQHHKILHIVE